MYQTSENLFNIEPGDAEQVRRIEARIGLATPEEIETAVQQNPKITLLEILLLKADKQARRRTGNA